MTKATISGPLLASALAAKPYDGDDIDWVLHTAAADLVDCTMADGSPTCRLFHRALDEHLRGPAEQQRNRQRALAGALEATVPQPEDDGVRDWSHASPYVRTHLD